MPYLMSLRCRWHDSRGHREGGIVADGGPVIAGGGEARRVLGDAALIGNWLEKGDDAAFSDVVTRVGTSSTGELDRLDAALLSLAAGNSDPDVRRRLIKLYAIFKIAEMQRYREFRGFPQ
jgi:hypothetical protein